MSLTQLFSQPDNFETNFNNYTSFAVDNDKFYIGLVNGFVVQDRITGGYEYYSTLNSNMLSNNINDIEVYKDKVYFLSDSVVYIYKEKAIKIFELENKKITGLYKDKDDLLWFSGDDVLISYDGTTSKEIDIAEQVEEYGKLESFVTEDNYLWLTFGHFNNRLRYALYDLSNDSMRTFSKEEHGFDQEYREYITFSDGVVWFKSNNRIYNYRISSNSWELVKLFLFPKEIEFKSNLVADSEGIIWFAVSKDKKTFITNYDGVSDSINILYNLEFDGDQQKLRFESFGGKILFSNKGSYNLIEDNKIIELIKYDEDFQLLKVSNYYENNDELYRLVDIYENGDTNVKFINIMNKESSPYTIIEEENLPLSNIGSYFVKDNMEFISNVYNSIEYVNKDGNWKGTSTIGIENDKRVNVEFDKNNKFYFYLNGIYKFDNGMAKKMFSYSAHWLKSVEIHNDKAFLYSSYPVGDHFVDFNLTRYYGVKVDVLDMSGNVNRTLNDSNSCISQWYEHGKANVFLYGPVPSDLKVDNEGKIWFLTAETLSYLNGNLMCTRFKFDKENGYPKPTYIAYSKFQDKMYGRKDNTIYDLSDTNYKQIDSEELVNGKVGFLGECNDGFVYASTTDGRLFKLNSLESWENIPLINGKEKINVSIRNVFRYEDTLYVSTEIGLIKVYQEVTSVEESEDYNDFKIYPNPTNDYINIDPKYIFESIEIRSIAGKLILESTGKEIIDVNALSPGVYTIKCGDKTTKFVKE